MLAKFVRWNVGVSLAFDRLLPDKYRIDGNQHFRKTYAPPHIMPGFKVYDVGSGAHPFLPPEVKQELGVFVEGIDIDSEELAQAPRGAYDAARVADLTNLRGDGDGDLVIAQSVLEHVQSTEAALEAIASLLKPGGVAVIFQPCRTAVFARLNRILPQGVKLRLLNGVFPETVRGYGFPAFYDRCTPDEFHAMARKAGLIPEQTQLYYRSAYFAFLFPLHIAWRLWALAYANLAGSKGAETFSMTLRKCSH